MCGSWLSICLKRMCSVMLMFCEFLLLAMAGTSCRCMQQSEKIIFCTCWMREWVPSPNPPPCSASHRTHQRQQLCAWHQNSPGLQQLLRPDEIISGLKHLAALFPSAGHINTSFHADPQRHSPTTSTTSTNLLPSGLSSTNDHSQSWLSLCRELCFSVDDDVRVSKRKICLKEQF